MSNMGQEENGRKGEQGKNPCATWGKKKTEGMVSRGRILEQQGAGRKGYRKGDQGKNP